MGKICGSDPEVWPRYYKTVPTQPNMKLQLLIKTKILKIKILFALKLSSAVFIFGRFNIMSVALPS